jgi:phenylacetic acid degradation operon negative regulatory protein
MTPAAKSLVLDLLSTLKEGSAMPVGALVEAGELFGLSGNNVRVSIARLLANGQIARDERGHYRLGEKAKPLGRRVRSWRDSNRRTRRWSGGWIAVHASGMGRAEKRARERALRLLGFGRLLPAFWVRPDNLAASVDELRADLESLGLPAGDLVCAVRDLDPKSEARARCLWNVRELADTYRGLMRGIDRSVARLADLSAGEAMVESYLVGGRALRHLVLDPLLPDEVCPAAERDALLAALTEYDRLGRLAWADLLKRYGVPHLRAPLSSRLDAQSARITEPARQRGEANDDGRDAR